MGVCGLHPVLKPYFKLINLDKYRGLRVGCDAFAWLHRGAISCATELATDDHSWVAAQRRAPYIDFCLRMIDMLMASGVVPVVGTVSACLVVLYSGIGYTCI